VGILGVLATREGNTKTAGGGKWRRLKRAAGPRLRLEEGLTWERRAAIGSYPAFVRPDRRGRDKIRPRWSHPKLEEVAQLRPGEIGVHRVVRRLARAIERPARAQDRKRRPRLLADDAADRPAGENPIQMLRVEPVPGAKRQAVNEVALDYVGHVKRRPRPFDLRLFAIQQRFDPALEIVLRTGDGIRQHFGEGVIGLKRQIAQPSP